VECCVMFCALQITLRWTSINHLLRKIKSETMKWADLTLLMWDMRNAHNILAR
jgi:hypothetical protein